MTRLPECQFRRDLVPGGRLYCLHPQMHMSQQLAHADICSACEVRQQRTTPAIRTLSDLSRARQRPQLDLVVARYRENVDWLSRFPETRQWVYEKDNPQADLSLPNVGREAQTYLHHIVENYDRLAEVTVFLQGHPFDHTRDLDHKIRDLPQECGFMCLSEVPLVETGTGSPIHPRLPVGQRYQELFNAPPLDYSLCRAGACFAVDRTTIHRHPREFYARLRDWIVTDTAGPWWVERMWKHIFVRPPRTRGVVTAADAGFFPELVFLIRSLQLHDDCEILVFDLGLRPEQRQWLVEQPRVRCRSLHFDGTCLAAVRRLNYWQTWLKPFCLDLADFDRLLWIDADCIVLGSLKDAFDHIAERPLLVRDATEAHTANDPRLDEWLSPPVDVPDASVNAGVVGLCRQRDQQLLACWAWGIQQISRKPQIQRLAAWWDQGILRWALRERRLVSTIQADLRWNQPAKLESQLLTRAVRGGHSILGEISQRYPTATIVHWLGAYKLSRQLAQQFADLFVSGLGMPEMRETLALSALQGGRHGH